MHQLRTLRCRLPNGRFFAPGHETGVVHIDQARSFRECGAGRSVPSRAKVNPHVPDRSRCRTALERVIGFASAGPSGHNTQPVDRLVIHDASEVKRLTGFMIDWMRFMIRQQPDLAKMILLDHVVDRGEKGYDGICRSAPHVVLTYTHKDNGMALSSCTIAMAYLELAALANDRSACWAGYFDMAACYWPPLQKELGLPADKVSYGAMMIEFPTCKYYCIPLRKETRISWK